MVEFTPMKKIFFIVISLFIAFFIGTHLNKGYSTDNSEDVSQVVYPTDYPTEFPTMIPTDTPAPIYIQPEQSYCSGATALCSDGTCSYSMHARGTCSYHGGVAQWNP